MMGLRLQYAKKRIADLESLLLVDNAVPPPFAEALVRANLPEICQQKQIAA